MTYIFLFYIEGRVGAGELGGWELWWGGVRAAYDMTY